MTCECRQKSEGICGCPAPKPGRHVRITVTAGYGKMTPSVPDSPFEPSDGG